MSGSDPVPCRFAYAWGNPLQYTDFEGFDVGQAEQGLEEQYRYKEAETLVEAMKSPGYGPGSSNLKFLAERLPGGAPQTPEQVDLECKRGDQRSCAGGAVMGAMEGVGSAATKMVVGAAVGSWWTLKSSAKLYSGSWADKQEVVEDVKTGFTALKKSAKSQFHLLGMALRDPGAVVEGAAIAGPRAISRTVVEAGVEAVLLVEGGVSVATKARALLRGGEKAEVAFTVGKSDLPYDPHTIRMGLETKYGPENVSSTTVPSSGAKGAKLASQRHPTSGIIFDQRGFPIFDDVAVADLRISSAQVASRNYPGQMRAATRVLRESIGKGEIPASQFTEAQLRAIEAGRAQIPGYTWHHHQDIGRMQLVHSDVHAATGHIGGFEMWYGR